MTERTEDTLDFEDELDAIRLQIYEEIKDMTPEEHVAYFRTEAEPVMKEFNMKWATLQPVIPYVRKRIGEEVLIRYE